MARPYFTLLERADGGGPWHPQFGDYDKETVELEKETYRGMGCRAKDLKIIRTSDAKQKTINAAIAALNA